MDYRLGETRCMQKHLEYFNRSANPLGNSNCWQIALRQRSSSITTRFKTDDRWRDRSERFWVISWIINKQCLQQKCTDIILSPPPSTGTKHNNLSSSNSDVWHPLKPAGSQWWLSAVAGKNYDDTGMTVWLECRGNVHNRIHAMLVLIVAISIWWDHIEKLDNCV